MELTRRRKGRAPRSGGLRLRSYLLLLQALLSKTSTHHPDYQSLTAAVAVRGRGSASASGANAASHPPLAGPRCLRALLLQSVKKTAEIINRKKAESERFQAFVELQAKLTGLAPKFEPLVKPNQERCVEGRPRKSRR